MAKKSVFVLLEQKEELKDNSAVEDMTILLFKNKKEAESMLKLRMHNVLHELFGYFNGTEANYSLKIKKLNAEPNHDGLFKACVYLEKEPNYYIADDSQNDYPTIELGTWWYIWKETVRCFF